MTDPVVIVPVVTAKDQILGAVRHSLSLVAGGLIAKALAPLISAGVVDNAQTASITEAVVGVALATIAYGWSWISKKIAGQKLTAAIAAPAGMATPPAN